MKGRFHKKALTTIICALLLIVFGIFLQLFVLGEPVDRMQVYFNTSVNGQSLDLRIVSIESGVALRGWRFEQDGGTLFIRARKVLVSPLFDKGYYETTINLESIDNISFGGQEIWSKQADIQDLDIGYNL